MEDIKKADYADFTSQSGKVIVEFKADWCPDCGRVKADYEKLAEENSKKAKFGRIDTEAERELHDEQGITSIPEFRFFENGKMVGKFVEPSYEELVQKTEKFLS